MEEYKNKKPKNNRWIGLVIFLLIANPGFFIPLGIFGGIIYLVYKNVSASQQGETSFSAPKAIESSTRQQAFDDCPQSLFCFHKDKGEHHVARGREVDPWNRPDIDISKYQRKR